MADDPDRPSCKAEADAHITSIRSEYFGSERLKDVVKKLQKVLSEQLYHHDGHFLLETLQNADDAEFGSRVPTLTFSLSRENGFTLLIQSNEKGFTKNDVESICGLGNSTKSSQGKERTSIGEKGLGFKSVFSVATVAEIRSGYYHFKFDRTQELGLINPILGNAAKSGKTTGSQILLHLNDEAAYHRVERELKALDPQSMLFLKNLRRISFESTNHNMHLVMTSASLHGVPTRTISIEDKVSGESRTKPFYCMKHEVSDMAPHESRLDVNRTIVEVAFPIEEDGTPRQSNQKTYAFLPINDYGFKFAINADLILTSSRESFQESLPWNISLQTGIVNGIVGSLSRLAQIPMLQYTWFRWLQVARGTSTYWITVEDLIFSQLGNRLLFKSLDPSLERVQAANLYFIPEKYRFEDGLLVEHSPSFRKYLSREYDNDYKELSMRSIIRKLGVKEMDNSFFLHELRDWLLSEDGAKTHRTLSWLVSVAEVFNTVYTEQAELRKLSIIPLGNDEWASANTPGLYLECKISGHVPPDTEFQVADPEAVRNSTLRSFFIALGLATLDADKVCNKILEAHDAARYNRHNLCGKRLDDWVADISFLYENWDAVIQFSSDRRWKFLRFVVQPLPTANLKYGMILRRSPGLHIGGTEKTSHLITKHWTNTDSFINIIHHKYFETICSSDGEKMNHFARSSTRSTDEFFVQKDKVGLLRELCDRWAEHSKPYDHGSKEVLLKGIKAVKFLCRDGVRRQLPEVAWNNGESEAFSQICPDIPYLDLPEGPGWKTFLPKLEVTTTLSVQALLYQLEFLARNQARMADYDIGKLYLHLHTSLPREVKQIQELAEKSDVVYIPTTRTWVSHKACVWKSAFDLKSKIVLEDHYPECSKLFGQIIPVSNAGAADYIEDSVSIIMEGSDGTAATRAISFLKRLDAISGPSMSNEIIKLKSLKIFPVHCPTYGMETQARFLDIREDSTDKWYIADRTSLQDAFRGRVPLLEIDQADVPEIIKIIEYLNLKTRLLSEAVKVEVHSGGTEVEHFERTSELRKKLGYILEIVNITEAAHTQYISNIRVFMVNKLCVTRILDSVTIQARSKYVHVIERSDHVDIWIPHNEDKRKVPQELARHFCDHFHIEDYKHHELVEDILASSLSDIPSVLEDSGLDSGSNAQLISKTRAEREISSPSSAPVTPPLRMESSNGLPTIAEATLPLTFSVVSPPSASPAKREFQNNDRSTLEVWERAGVDGEEYMNGLFSESIKDWCTIDNWTSNLRKYCGYPPFCETGGNADFTYVDKVGEMKKLLQNWMKKGTEALSHIPEAVRYHIELKTSSGDLEEEFHLSGGQMRTARQCHLNRLTDEAADVYVLIRLYNFRQVEKGIKVCVDPWSDNGVAFWFPDDVQGWVVKRNTMKAQRRPQRGA
ncbi:hypothetical protein JX266_006040 [Neoarthrinium moseri]|nr:hypothetical protein JX266_006040 [Neoarthrinium moseri]